jgi:hypothetical protein
LCLLFAFGLNPAQVYSSGSIRWNHALETSKDSTRNSFNASFSEKFFAGGDEARFTIPETAAARSKAGPSLLHPIAPKAGAVGTPVRSGGQFEEGLAVPGITGGRCDFGGNAPASEKFTISA